MGGCLGEMKEGNFQQSIVHNGVKLIVVQGDIKEIQAGVIVNISSNPQESALRKEILTVVDLKAKTDVDKQESLSELQEDIPVVELLKTSVFSNTKALIHVKTPQQQTVDQLTNLLPKIFDLADSHKYFQIAFGEESFKGLYPLNSEVVEKIFLHFLQSIDTSQKNVTFQILMIKLVVSVPETFNVFSDVMKAHTEKVQKLQDELAKQQQPIPVNPVESKEESKEQKTAGVESKEQTNQIETKPQQAESKPQQAVEPSQQNVQQQQDPVQPKVNESNGEQTNGEVEPKNKKNK